MEIMRQSFLLIAWSPLVSSFASVLVSLLSDSRSGHTKTLYIELEAAGNLSSPFGHMTCNSL